MAVFKYKPTCASTGTKFLCSDVYLYSILYQTFCSEIVCEFWKVYIYKINVIFSLWQSFWCPMTFDPFNFSWKKHYQKICFLILLHHYNLYNLSFIAATCKFQEICIWEFLCRDAFWLSNLIRLDVVLAWADDSVI